MGDRVFFWVMLYFADGNEDIAKDINEIIHQRYQPQYSFFLNAVVPVAANNWLCFLIQVTDDMNAIDALSTLPFTYRWCWGSPQQPS